MLRKIAYVLLGLLVLAIIVITVALYRADTYLRSDQVKIITSPLFKNGYAKVGKVEVDFFSKFPHPEISAYDLSLIDSSATKLGYEPAFKAKKARLKISIIELLKNKIVVQNLALDSAHIVFYADSKISYNPVSIFDRAKKDDKRKPEDKVNIGIQNAELELHQVSLSYVDKNRKKNIQGTINKLTSILHVHKDTSATISMDLSVGSLAFNTDKGGYLTDAHVKGDVEAYYKNGMLQFLPCVMNINGDDYHAFSNLAFDKKTPSVLHVHKNNTVVANTRKLLTRKIQEGISPFDVEGEIQASADIEFYPGDKNPRAVVSLYFPNNTMHAYGRTLTNGVLKGRFINRLYDSYDKFYGEDKQNLTFYIDSLEAKYMGFDVKCNNGWINFGPAVGTHLDIVAKAGGNASLISELLDNNQFLFRKGIFEADLSLRSSADDLYSIIKGANGNIEFKDLDILYAKENVSIPVHYLSLKKNQSNGKFTLISTTPIDNDILKFEGQATQINDLLAGIPNNMTKSEVTLSSDQLSWTGILSLINAATSVGGTSVQSPSPETNTSFALQKKSIKSLLQSIYEGFHPVIYADIKKFDAPYNLFVRNFSTTLGFIDKGTILLDKTSFNLNKAEIHSRIKLSLEQAYITPFDLLLSTSHLSPQNILRNMKILTDSTSERVLRYLPDDLSFRLGLRGELDDNKGLEPNTLNGEINFETKGNSDFNGDVIFQAENALKDNRLLQTEIKLNGNPRYINPFFERLNISFGDSDYKLNIKYNHVLQSTKDMVQNAEIDFNIGNTKLTYLTTGTVFPIEYFSLNTNNDIGFFDLMLYSKETDEHLALEGKVDNISQLLYRNTSKKASSSVSIYSPKISWIEITKLFQDLRTDTTTHTDLSSKTKNQHFENILQYTSTIDSVEQLSAEDIYRLKQTIQNLFNSLDPDVNLNLDTLIYSPSLQVHNLSSELSMTSDSILHIEDTKFGYEDGQIQLSGYVDLKERHTIPYSSRFISKNINLAHLLKSLKIDQRPSLKDIDSLNGILDFDLLLVSEIIDSIPSYIPPNTYGHLSFVLRELGATGIHYIDNITKNKKLRARLRDIYIDSMSNNIIIDENKLLIPLMEVQSNAFQFFIEGVYDEEPDNNLWLSIPLSNLKRHKEKTVPPHTGYALAGPMVYLEVINQAGQVTKTKLHLSKRKFFKDKDITYRDFKKGLRQERRKSRKAKKLN